MAKQKKNPVTTNANGRELAPQANRGELQVTLGRGNVLIRNPHSSEPFFEQDFSGFHKGPGPMVANPGKYNKGKKRKNNPHGDDHNSRRPRPYQGVVDAVTDSVESRFSAPGREIIPGGQNRGELQLTSGRGNLVMRNPNEPFFEDDNSGFFQTKKDGKYSVLANPALVKRTKSLPNGISIRLRKGKGFRGKRIWWVDYRLKTWKRGVSALLLGPSTKERATVIFNRVSKHVKNMSQKEATNALINFALAGKRNPSNEFIFERDLSGFYQGPGPRVANPKHSDDGFPYARDLSGRFPDKDLGESSAGAVQAGGQFDERFVIAEGGTLQHLVANPHNVNLRYTECPECELGMKLESGVNNFTCPGCNTAVSVA